MSSILNLSFAMIKRYFSILVAMILLKIYEQLFNFHFSGGISSSGRALASHARGAGIKARILHLTLALSDEGCILQLKNQLIHKSKTLTFYEFNSQSIFRKY